MPTETCAVCAEAIALGDAVHVMFNPDDGVRDHYVCQPCYEAEFLAPLDPDVASAAGALESDDSDSAASERAGGTDQSADGPTAGDATTTPAADDNGDDRHSDGSDRDSRPADTNADAPGDDPPA